MKNTKQLFGFLVYGDENIEAGIGIDTNRTFQVTFTMFQELINEHNKDFRLAIDKLAEDRGVNNDFDAGYVEALEKIKELIQ